MREWVLFNEGSTAGNYEPIFEIHRVLYIASPMCANGIILLSDLTSLSVF